MSAWVRQLHADRGCMITGVFEFPAVLGKKNEYTCQEYPDHVTSGSIRMRKVRGLSEVVLCQQPAIARKGSLLMFAQRAEPRILVTQ